MVRMKEALDEEHCNFLSPRSSLQPGMSDSPVAADLCGNGHTFLRSAFQAVAKWRGIITG